MKENSNDTANAPINKTTDYYSPMIIPSSSSGNNRSRDNTNTGSDNENDNYNYNTGADSNHNNNKRKSKSNKNDLPMISDNSIQIKQQIGKTTYATVYYGQWQGTPVALKVQNNPYSH